MKKIIVVLNDFEKVDDVLKKAVMLGKKHDTFLEILYVHESPLFDLPDYFCAKENLNNNLIDKEKVKKEINERILKLGFTKNYAILVFDDDTIDRVITQTSKDTNSLILMAYHKKISLELAEKSNLPLLIVKNSVINYKKILLPVDLGENMYKCINFANTIFPDTQKKLVYDYLFVCNPTILDDTNFLISAPNPILNREINEELRKNQLHEFEVLKKETGFEGDFIEGLISLEDDLSKYININNFDLTILCSNREHFLFFNSRCFSLLETITTDILIQG